jgi:hypothetical protein
MRDLAYAFGQTRCGDATGISMNAGWSKENLGAPEWSRTSGLIHSESILYYQLFLWHSCIPPTPWTTSKNVAQRFHSISILNIPVPNPFDQHP